MCREFLDGASSRCAFSNSAAVQQGCAVERFQTVRECRFRDSAAVGGARVLDRALTGNKAEQHLYGPAALPQGIRGRGCPDRRRRVRIRREAAIGRRGPGRDVVPLADQQHWEIHNRDMSNTGATEATRRGVHVTRADSGTHYRFSGWISTKSTATGQRRTTTPAPDSSSRSWGTPRPPGSTPSATQRPAPHRMVCEKVTNAQIYNNTFCLGQQVQIINNENGPAGRGQRQLHQQHLPRGDIGRPEEPIRTCR